MLNEKKNGVYQWPIDYLQEEHETNPLIVSVLLSLAFGIRFGIVDAEEGHFQALSLSVRRGYRVRAVYPAVSVQDVLGQVLAVYAVDGIADVLAGRDDQGERYQQDHSQAVMQAEDGAVDVDVRDFYETLQTAKYVQHLGSTRTIPEVREIRGCAGPRRFPRITSPQDSTSLHVAPAFVFYIFRSRFRDRFSAASEFRFSSTFPLPRAARVYNHSKRESRKRAWILLKRLTVHFPI